MNREKKISVNVSSETRQLLDRVARKTKAKKYLLLDLAAKAAFGELTEAEAIRLRSFREILGLKEKSK